MFESLCGLKINMQKKAITFFYERNDSAKYWQVNVSGPIGDPILITSNMIWKFTWDPKRTKNSQNYEDSEHLRLFLIYIFDIRITSFFYALFWFTIFVLYCICVPEASEWINNKKNNN